MIVCDQVLCDQAAASPPALEFGPFVHEMIFLPILRVVQQTQFRLVREYFRLSYASLLKWSS
jgi:hypothetical protein